MSGKKKKKKKKKKNTRENNGKRVACGARNSPVPKTRAGCLFAWQVRIQVPKPKEYKACVGVSRGVGRSRRLVIKQPLDTELAVEHSLDTGLVDEHSLDTGLVQE